MSALRRQQRSCGAIHPLAYGKQHILRQGLYQQNTGKFTSAAELVISGDVAYIAM